MADSPVHESEHLQSRMEPGQPAWQRIVLLIVLGYEGAGCLYGGILLISAPDGSKLEMPLEMLHGAFPDFMIPGIILTGMGILNILAFVSVLRRFSSAWIFVYLALGGMLIWFLVEIAILHGLHWLHAMWGLPVVVGLVMAIPLIRKRTRSDK